MHQTYKNLGYIEPFDQIEVTRAVIEQNKFIDPERVGIYGWSYGHGLWNNESSNTYTFLKSVITYDL